MNHTFLPLQHSPQGRPQATNGEVRDKHTDLVQITSESTQQTTANQGEPINEENAEKELLNSLTNERDLVKRTHAMSLRSGRQKVATFNIPDNRSCPDNFLDSRVPVDQSIVSPSHQNTGAQNNQNRPTSSVANTQIRHDLLLEQMENIRRLERIQEDREIQFEKQKLQILQSQLAQNAGSARAPSVVDSVEQLNRTIEWAESHHRGSHHIGQITSKSLPPIMSQPSQTRPALHQSNVQKPSHVEIQQNKSVKKLVYDTVFQNQLEKTTPSHPPNMRSTPLNEQCVPPPPVEHHHGMSSWNLQSNTNVGNITLQPEQIASRMMFSSKNLPSFNGNPLEWPKFISSYVFSTRQCGFTNVDNLERLKQALKPPAYDLVRNRLIIPETVPGVIEKLRTHFGRPELVLRALTQQVRNLPPVKSDKYTSLINFASEVDNLCGLAEASQLQTYMNDPTLLEELVDKLPYHLGIDWGNYSKRFEHVDLLRFSHWLNEITEGAVKVSKIDLSKFLPSCEQKSAKKSGHKPTIGNFAHFVKNDVSQKSEIKKCVICNCDDHLLVKCEKFLQMDVDQRWKLIQKHLWCGKCILPHNYKRCRNRQRCQVDQCNRPHHFLLHKSGSVNNTAGSSTVSNNETQTILKINLNPRKQKEVLYRIVPVILYGENGKQFGTYAFLDEGSNGTIMEEWVADYLDLKGPKMDVCLQWTKEITTMEEGSMSVSPRISGSESGAEQFKLESVRTAKTLALPCQSLPVESLPQYIQDLPIEQYKNAKPTILIGSDEAWLMVPTEVRHSGRESPIATRTKLGWAVYGKHETQNIGLYCQQIRNGTESDDQLNDLVKNFYAIDTYGTEHSNVIESKEVIRSREILANTTTYTGGRFTCGLLWKFNDVKLPNSLSMAHRRLNSFEAKLLKDPELGRKVKDLIQGYIDKGYIRKLLAFEVGMKTRSWYLPIFVVQNPNKPNKIRLVWDAASKVDGVSLNSALMKGPDELAPLPAVLFKFRQERIAVTGDIMEMFHQINVTEQDADSQRFLWRNLDTSRKPDTFIMRVMTFGATCSPAIAQHIKNRNAEQFADKYPRAVEAIQNRHYVDDWLDSFHTIDEAIQTVTQVKTIHQHAGFKIRGWISNSPELLKAIGDDVNGQSHQIRDKGALGDKVLGLWWDHTHDQFRFSLNTSRIDPELLNGIRAPTKREVLKILMSVFDPLGLISNFLMYGKLILQEIWRSNSDWDEPISSEINEKWTNWTKHLSTIDQLCIPRCYDLASRPAKYQLHIFTDASQYVYAAVAYIRTTTPEGTTTALVASKTRVAPNNKLISIPRLELMAAVLGVRLSATIVKSHSIQFESKHYWTDSKTVVSWLNSDARSFRQFVAYRITECLDKSNEREWHWLASKQNVADEATKWVNNSPNLDPDSRWIHGPKFLLEPESNWPIPSNEDLGTVEEFRLNYHHIDTAVPILAADPTRCSTWSVLLGAQIKFNRACHMFLSLAKKSTPIRGPTTLSEIQDAQRILIQKAQWDMFKKEITMLRQNNNSKVDRESQLVKLLPYLDKNGILREKGRIDEASCVATDVKRKIIMPRKHRTTFLLVQGYHVTYQHQNNETIFNELRQKYEIANLRTLIKDVRFNCLVCQERKAKPAPPQMAPLPPARLAAFCRPFSYVGIDYFGPLTVTVGRRSEKRWGVVYTCMTIRAIHLEVSPSLTTDSFIQSFLRFRARRGNPIEVYTDNGTNFKGAERELKEEFKKLNFQDAQNRLTSFNWRFIPPSSPHFGGAWERMVRTVKSNLYNILGSKKLNDEILLTSLAEVENIINTRPLTYLPVDSNNEAITPNHFLLGESSGSKPLADLDPSAKAVYKNWLKTQQITNQFWRRWIVEYLPVLTKRTKWFDKVEPLKIGDIVVIVDERNSRGCWPKGVVVDVHMGKGNQVRSAVIKTITGLYTRPAAKLAKLDVRGEHSDEEHSPRGSVSEETRQLVSSPGKAAGTK